MNLASILGVPCLIVLGLALGLYLTTSTFYNAFDKYEAGHPLAGFVYFLCAVCALCGTVAGITVGVLLLVRVL